MPSKWRVGGLARAGRCRRLERGRLPAAAAAFAVARDEVAEQRRVLLPRGRDGLAGPDAGEHGGGLFPCLGLDAKQKRQLQSIDTVSS